MMKNLFRAWGRYLENAARPFLVRARSYFLFETIFKFTNFLRGRKIRLDASSVCQLKCPACSTALGKNARGVVGRGHLKARHFRKLLRQNPDIRSIELSNWGEIFLNPEIVPIMRYAYKHNVRLSAANGVNLNTVKPGTLRKVVEYQFRHLSISIDGASPDTYAQYRVGGDFNRVMDNIRQINHYKKELNSPFPKLSWQFVVFGHNEHELPLARKMAEELDMTLRPKLNHTPTMFPVQNEGMVRIEAGFGAASRDEYRAKKKTEYSFPCIQLWTNPQINWDGRLLGCCVNKWGHFGKTFSEGLNECLNGERYGYAKKMVLGLLPPRNDIPCIKCKTYYRLNPEYASMTEEVRSVSNSIN